MARNERIVPEDVKVLKDEIDILLRRRDEIAGDISLDSKRTKLLLEIANLENQKKLLGEKIRCDHEAKRKDLEDTLFITTQVAENKVKAREKELNLQKVELFSLRDQKLATEEELKRLSSEYKTTKEEIDKEKHKVEVEKARVADRDKELSQEIHKLTIAKRYLEIAEREILDGIKKLKHDRADFELDCVSKTNKLQNKKEEIDRLEHKVKDAIDGSYTKLAKEKQEFIEGRDTYNETKKNLVAFQKHLDERESKIKDREKNTEQRETDLELSWEAYEKAKKIADWKKRETLL